MTPKKDWTIKTLWIGVELGPLEQLCLSSFLHHGHQVELFVYDDVGNIPAGVTVRNGEEILKSSNIFMYKHRPSYAAFANWFRYEMLLKEGGVWVDTDVACLKPFDFESNLFFGLEQSNKVNNAVIGAVPGLESIHFMARQAEHPNHFLPYDSTKEKCRKFIRRYLKGNQRGDLKWGETGPGGFTKALHHFDLFDKALPISAFYPIHSTCWTSSFDTTAANPERYFPDSYAIHFWNEMLRRDPNFNINSEFPENSLFEELKRRYL